MNLNVQRFEHCRRSIHHDTHERENGAKFQKSKICDRGIKKAFDSSGELDDDHMNVTTKEKLTPLR